MDVHCLIDLVDCQAAVDVLESFAGILHCRHGFFVDVGGFDTGDLAL